MDGLQWDEIGHFHQKVASNRPADTGAEGSIDIQRRNPQEGSLVPVNGDL